MLTNLARASRAFTIPRLHTLRRNSFRYFSDESNRKPKKPNANAIQNDDNEQENTKPEDKIPASKSENDVEKESVSRRGRKREVRDDDSKRPLRRINGDKVDKALEGEQKRDIPAYLPQLLAIPLTKRPLFPGFYKSLYIKDKMVAQAIQHLWAKRKPYIGIFLAKDSNSESDIVSDLNQVERIGVFAQITNLYQSVQDNAALTVVVYPHRRIRLTGISDDLVALSDSDVAKADNFRLANVENLVEEPYNPDSRVIKATSNEIINVMKEISTINPLLRDQIITISVQTGNLLLEPAKLADFAAAVSSGDPLELQSVLESLVVEERLNKALVILKKELENAKLQQEISREVDKKINRKQQEYFLMEQLKGIKKQLGMEGDGKEKLIENFKEKASKLQMPDDVKVVFDDELKKLMQLEPAASEFNVTRNYLDWLTQIPWGKHSHENFDVKNAKVVLDEDHYGLSDVKDRILEFIAVGKLRGTVQGKIVTFVGPPGVGKTSIGKSIAKALGREFYRFSVGGLNDVAEIKGHRRTYVGAMPGKIVQALKKVKTENPLIMIDEIDKLGRGHQGDPASALLELLDPEQNNAFLDHYLDVPVDLSKVLFVCTANTLETIPAPLLDRMEVITLSGYVSEEKVAIATKYLSPVAKEAAGLQAYDVNLTKDAIMKLIRGYCRESGVRNLKKQIEKVYRKAAFKLVKDDLKNEAISITEDNLQDFVGLPLFTTDRLYETAPAGVVMGLAWTQLGGSSLFIESVVDEAVTEDSKPRLQHTGQMGDVMKESTRIAYTFAKSFFANHFPRNTFFKHASIHMHVPEGATPKDGPSAGSTMTTSLLSLALNQPIKENTAMTGEITLTGKILKIGGVKEKAIAAKRSAVKNIIFPAANKSDWNELPEFIKDGLHPHFVSHYDEIFAIAFPSVKKQE